MNSDLSPLKRLEEAGWLPLGHYERKEAQEAVNKEYALIHSLERELKPMLPVQYVDTLQEAATFCYKLCTAIGSRPVKKLVVSTRIVPRTASACYVPWEKAIHFNYRCFHISTLIHETAHHVHFVEQYGGEMHGREYCEIVKLLYDVALTLFNNKCGI